MKNRFNLLALALLLCACSTETSDTGSDSWVCQYCSGVEIHQTETGCWFNIPSKDGVHYVTKNLSGNNEVQSLPRMAGEATSTAGLSPSSGEIDSSRQSDAQTISANYHPKPSLDAKALRVRPSSEPRLSALREVGIEARASTNPGSDRTSQTRPISAKGGDATCEEREYRQISAQYIRHPHRSNVALTVQSARATAITATFAISGAGKFTAAGGGTPQVRLYFQRKGDNLSAIGDYQYYRWWSVMSVPLSEISVGGTHTITVPLAPKNWQSVYGVNGAKAVEKFDAAKDDMAVAGLTFGDQYGFGHGVWGSGKFTLTSYTIQ